MCVDDGETSADKFSILVADKLLLASVAKEKAVNRKIFSHRTINGVGADEVLSISAG